jgi:hypothetical protein
MTNTPKKPARIIGPAGNWDSSWLWVFGLKNTNFSLKLFPVGANSFAKNPAADIHALHKPLHRE